MEASKDTQYRGSGFVALSHPIAQSLRPWRSVSRRLGDMRLQTGASGRRCSDRRVAIKRAPLDLCQGRSWWVTPQCTPSWQVGLNEMKPNTPTLAITTALIFSSPGPIRRYHFPINIAVPMRRIVGLPGAIRVASPFTCALARRMKYRHTTPHCSRLYRRCPLLSRCP